MLVAVISRFKRDETCLFTASLVTFKPSHPSTAVHSHLWPHSTNWNDLNLNIDSIDWLILPVQSQTWTLDFNYYGCKTFVFILFQGKWGEWNSCWAEGWHKHNHKHNNIKLDSYRIHKNLKGVAQYILMNLKKAILHSFSSSYMNPRPWINMQSVSGHIRVMASDHFCICTWY